LRSVQPPFPCQAEFEVELEKFNVVLTLAIQIFKMGSNRACRLVVQHFQKKCNKRECWNGGNRATQIFIDIEATEFLLRIKYHFKLSTIFRCSSNLHLFLYIY
jgi:hypothetical protein